MRRPPLTAWRYWRTLPFPVSGARLVPSNNNDVWRLETGYLRVAWRGTEAASPGR